VGPTCQSTGVFTAAGVAAQMATKTPRFVTDRPPCAARCGAAEHVVNRIWVARRRWAADASSIRGTVLRAECYF